MRISVLPTEVMKPDDFRQFIPRNLEHLATNFHGRLIVVQSQQFSPQIIAVDGNHQVAWRVVLVGSWKGVVRSAPRKLDKKWGLLAKG